MLQQRVEDSWITNLIFLRLKSFYFALITFESEIQCHKNCVHLLLHFIFFIFFANDVDMMCTWDVRWCAMLHSLSLLMRNCLCFSFPAFLEFTEFPWAKFSLLLLLFLCAQWNETPFFLALHCLIFSISFHISPWVRRFMCLVHFLPSSRQASIHLNESQRESHHPNWKPAERCSKKGWNSNS